MPTTETPAATITTTANHASGTVRRGGADDEERSYKCIGFGTKTLSDKHFAEANGP
jgi:hypothetical protein